MRVSPVRMATKGQPISLSSAAVARAVHEALTQSYWMADPDIRMRERVGCQQQRSSGDPALRHVPAAGRGS